MTVLRSTVSVWEALAGRAPGEPLGPAEHGVWAAVVDRLNPARATPRLRAGIEQSEMVSVRGVPYVMLRSPDGGGRACYLRLTVEEARLAALMDGTVTVARLVAEFARISGRLAPDQVRRVVADLAGNRMLDELPVDAFGPLHALRRRPWPARVGRTVLAVARGRRTVIANIDPAVTLLYRAGGRLLFTRQAAVLLALLAVTGLGLFVWSWAAGERAVFRTGGSYATGAAALLGLNVIALACHELGHALAVKHAGRRVPVAGVLIYFGIPSVFVDTTDVWMAGRRARLVTTAAGPAAGLVLAGAAQLTGVLVPAVAPLAFVLSFAWYLNALFNLNPMVALDGYYLLMDWLELPNLRTRGLAWVVRRLRRRPPAWRELDREGRLIALYGMIAVAWLVIAVNLAWRIWTDRVAGLTLGLWRAGPAARLLLIAVLVGLAAPLVYALVGWLARRARRLATWLGERRLAADLPNRADVLRSSALAPLPPAALAALAQHSRWRHPSAGEPVLFSGAAQQHVLVVADGGLEGRRPGDHTGTVRQRVGAGGLVGLANALVGAPAALTWHATGTRLLAVPAPLVAAAVRPLAGPSPGDRAEAEDLFAETPALESLPAEERMGLAAGARPELLAPGTPVELTGARDVVVVAAGEITLPDGRGLRRGTMIGPMGDQPAGPVATARTPVRLWRLPAVSGLPLLLGGSGRSDASGARLSPGPGPGSGSGSGFGSGFGPAPGSGPATRPGTAPVVGVHPRAGYPPLAAPPGPPPERPGDETDDRFERRLRWLLLLLLLFGLLLTGGNLIPGPAWAEMPTDRALLVAERGRVTATIGAETVSLRPGDRVYVGVGDRVVVGDRGYGRLTYRGGARSLLCPGSRTGIGPMTSGQSRPVTPYARLHLERGRLLADTESTSPVFADLVLTVGSHGHTTVNVGPARHTVAGGRTAVAAGRVTRDGAPLPVTAARLTCGGAVPPGPAPVPPGEAGSPSGPPPVSPTPSVTPSVTPSATPWQTPTPTPAPTPGVRTPSPSRASTPGTGPTRPTTRPPTTAPTATPSRDRLPPRITGVSARPTLLAQRPPAGTYCEGAESQVTGATVTAQVADPTDAAADLRVSFTWTLSSTGRSGGGAMTGSGGTFTGGFSVDHVKGQDGGGTITIVVVARDPSGNSDTATTTIHLDRCTPTTIIT